MTTQAFYWTPWGLAGLVSGAAALAAAVFVYRTAPDPRIRFRFTVLLILEGILVLTSGASPIMWIGSSRLVQAGYTFHVMNDCLVLAVYLPAVAAAIDSPLLKPFRSGRGVLLPVFVGLTGAALVLTRPELFVVGVGEGLPPRYGTPYFPVNGVGAQVAWGLLTISYTYGFVATVLAWHQAKTPLARRRAGAFSWAFGTRDLFLGGAFVYLALNTNTASNEAILLVLQIAMWAVLVYVTLTAYGIATVHLFDIELRLKWTLERGTLAAAFIAVFFVVSEGTAAVLSDRWGTLVGLLATGLLVFALAPLQRFVERLANTTLPSVRDTPEYRSFRKLQIYGEAVAEARREGVITPPGRLALRRLRESLGLSDAEADGLEADLSDA